MCFPMYFKKYEACGNDNVLVDSSDCGELDWPRLAQEICKRRFSVGADGLLVVSSADADVAHARMRIFNSDGSEADMCGNGVRCVAKYVIKNGDKYGISDVDSLVSCNIPVVARIQTNCGVKPVTRRKNSDGECFSVNMGEAKVGKRFTLAVLDRVFSVIPVDVGNPHAVIFLEESVNDFPLEKYAPLIENDAMFPNKTNVEFAFVSSRDEVVSKIWERGVVSIEPFSMRYVTIPRSIAFLCAVGLPSFLVPGMIHVLLLQNCFHRVSGELYQYFVGFCVY